MNHGHLLSERLQGVSLCLIAAVLFGQSARAELPFTRYCMKCEKHPEFVKDVAKVTKVIYKKVDNKDLKMFIYQPNDLKPGESRPTVLFFHGGGWLRGDAEAGNIVLVYFASRGLVCVDAEYRLLEGEGHGDAKSPVSCLADAKSAMRWVKTHAKEYNIDPLNIITSGASAGGHLAAALPTIPGYDEKGDDLSISVMPQAVVLLNPAFDMVNGWGGGRERCVAAGLDPAKFSPALNVSSNMPPFIILSGSEDAVCPPGACKAFVKKVTEKGGIAKFVEFPGQRHGFYSPKRDDGANFEKAMADADQFLQTLGFLKAKAASPEKKAN